MVQLSLKILPNEKMLLFQTEIREYLKQHDLKLCSRHALSGSSRFGRVDFILMTMPVYDESCFPSQKIGI